jgi:hypothetical protein
MLGQDRGGPRAEPERPGKLAPSIQDALLKPFSFTFAKPTPLDEAARRLGQALNTPVVVDLAAIDRAGLKPDDEVQLVLEGVRLKTGLKLLLDQLDLTYRVVPEDNLLIITDATGSDDPVDRLLTEMKGVHRDIHDLQDAVDEVRTALGIDEGEGPKMRKPTIIEEVPAEGAKPAKPKEEPPPTVPPTRSRPGL